MLTVMLQCETPEVAIGRIRNANCHGAEAYGLQIESLKPEYHNEETYKRLFAEMHGRPSYVTNYRSFNNVGFSDEQLAEGHIALAKSGATLVDVMGDFFKKTPGELTDDHIDADLSHFCPQSVYSCLVLLCLNFHDHSPYDLVLS